MLTIVRETRIDISVPLGKLVAFIYVLLRNFRLLTASLVAILVKVLFEGLSVALH